MKLTAARSVSTFAREASVARTWHTMNLSDDTQIEPRASWNRLERRHHLRPSSHGATEPRDSGVGAAGAGWIAAEHVSAGQQRQRRRIVAGLRGRADPHTSPSGARLSPHDFSQWPT